MPGSGFPVPGESAPASAVVQVVPHDAQWFLSLVRSAQMSPASEVHFESGFAHEPSIGFGASCAASFAEEESLELLASVVLASGSSTANVAQAPAQTANRR